MITICLLAAMRHWEEFDLHIKTAINNGVKKNEIAEALFHVAIYAGVPAANTAFRRVKKLGIFLLILCIICNNMIIFVIFNIKMK